MLIFGISGEAEGRSLLHIKDIGFALYRELMLISVPSQTSVISWASPGGMGDELSLLTHLIIMINRKEGFVNHCMFSFKTIPFKRTEKREKTEPEEEHFHCLENICIQMFLAASMKMSDF